MNFRWCEKGRGIDRNGGLKNLWEARQILLLEKDWHLCSSDAFLTHQQMSVFFTGLCDNSLQQALNCWSPGWKIQIITFPLLLYWLKTLVCVVVNVDKTWPPVFYLKWAFDGANSGLEKKGIFLLDVWTHAKSQLSMCCAIFFWSFMPLTIGDPKLYLFEKNHPILSFKLTKTFVFEA